MRRLFIWLVGIAVVVGFAAVGTFSDVTNSSHNLSTSGPLTDKSSDEDQICVFCHTPHEATVTVPLWNHSMSAVASYDVYSSGTSPTLDAVDLTDIGGGTDISNLCMSCHDGTIAVNSLGNPSNDLGANPTMGSGTELNVSFQIDAARATNLGQDLSDDHPINFTYDSNLALTLDGELADPFDTAYVDAARTVPLFNSKLQCASCHDPHDNTNQPFLVKDNTGSALCLTCHQK